MRKLGKNKNKKRDKDKNKDKYRHFAKNADKDNANNIISLIMIQMAVVTVVV